MVKNDIQFYLGDTIEVVEGEGRVSLANHTHNSLIITLVTEGSVTCKIDGAPHNFLAGDGYVLPPNTPI